MSATFESYRSPYVPPAPRGIPVQMAPYELLAFAKASLRSNAVVLCLLCAFVVLPIQIARELPDLFAYVRPETTFGLRYSVGLFLLASYVDVGARRVLLAVARGNTVEASSLIVRPRTYVSALIANVIVNLAATVGMMALVIPGIFVVVVTQYASWLIADRDLGPIAAIVESWRRSDGHRWRLLASILLAVVIVILGTLLLGVGLIWALPLAGLVLAHAYLHGMGERVVR
jgi:hypothetical protein